MAKQYVALARVSSREQEREGFSLDVQEDALTRYAERQGGSIVQLYRIAETASKQDERRTFKTLLGYVKEHAGQLDGVLFYKVDRAARNLFDYVELERLEADHGIAVHYVTQPTENTPAGRMQRRILANMAAFYTEQQSLDVQEGMARRVKSGLFPGHARYGYRNVRVDGRSLVEVDPQEAKAVRRLFELYAYHGHTLDTLAEALFKEGFVLRPSAPKFPRSTLHAMLRDRAYIGDVYYRGQWYPGTQPSLIEKATWERVQVLMGNKVCRSHDMTYAGELVTCSHCGRPITGETKTKKTKHGERDYVYYRCAGYNTAGHPRVRVTEADLDQQVLRMFDRIRIKDDDMREWFGRALRERARATQESNQGRFEELKKQITVVKQQKDRLLNLRLMSEIEAETFAEKSRELKEKIDRLTLEIEAGNRKSAEHAELVVKTFELSQALQEKYINADPAAKRHLLEIVCLNFSLQGATLIPTMRKPFSFLAEGLSFATGRGGGT